MQLPNKWKPEDLLTLCFHSGFNANQIVKYVDSYKSYDGMMKSKDPYIKSKVKQDQIFMNDLALAKEIALEQLELAEKKEIKLVSYWDEDYPELLKAISYPPPFLFVRGALKPSKTDSFSIVGTRRCTVYGKLATEQFAEYFSSRGVIITSGLAYGIDSYAHLATLKNNAATYAIIASGIDCISSSNQQQLADKIVENGGAIISTYKIGTVALPPFFLQRNRLISGMSKATLIVESGEKGGSLNTARNAFEQERDVFAVPGAISSEKSKGTNQLIKKNIAQIAITPADVYQEAQYSNLFSETDEQKEELVFGSENEEAIYNVLSMEPMHIDDIVNETHLDVSTVLVEILNLEFKDFVKQLPGKYYVKTK